jgi:hypothetical protein
MLNEVQNQLNHPVFITVMSSYELANSRISLKVKRNAPSTHTEIIMSSAIFGAQVLVQIIANTTIELSTRLIAIPSGRTKNLSETGNNSAKINPGHKMIKPKTTVNLNPSGISFEMANHAAKPHRTVTALHINFLMFTSISPAT